MWGGMEGMGGMEDVGGMGCREDGRGVGRDGSRNLLWVRKKSKVGAIRMEGWKLL